MAFFLKKFIAFWLSPIPFCAAAIILGLWVTRGGRASRAGRRLIGLAAAVLLVLGNNYASAWLLRPLETVYAPVPELRPGAPIPAALGGCQYVVVLGGGHADMSSLAAASKLSNGSLGRLVEGVRLAQALPDTRLIVSGPPEGKRPSHASVLAQAALSLGIAPDRIILVDTARDTEAEAKAVRSIVGDAPVALVTSAWHMPRAMDDFRAARVNALPCPADFRYRMPDGFHIGNMSWDAESLERSAAAIHERLGELWMRLKGRR